MKEIKGLFRLGAIALVLSLMAILAGCDNGGGTNAITKVQTRVELKSVADYMGVGQAIVATVYIGTEVIEYPEFTEVVWEQAGDNQGSGAVTVNKPKTPIILGPDVNKYYRATTTSGWWLTNSNGQNVTYTGIVSSNWYKYGD